MVAQNLKAYIVDKGIKQRTIAARAGMTEQILSDILTGRRRLLADEFINICSVLGRAPEDFISTEEGAYEND